MKEVCIIGAGVAGLVAARYLKEHFYVTIFEATSRVGGIWLYNKDNNDAGSTAMYKNLRTNLPKQLMSFRNFPYDGDLPTFLTHSQVESYLVRFCNYFSIRELIKFDTPVISVKPEINNIGSSSLKWIVESSQGNSEYDAVAVCTGRYDRPHIPTIDGFNLYSGKYIHSKAYSMPEDFNGSHVLVVGAHASGIDLTLDLFEHGVKVDISHRKPEPASLSPQITQFKEPVRFEKDHVYFKNDDTGYKFDMIIFATGYDRNLEYLHPDCLLDTDILPRPLYNFIINPHYASMALFNQCSMIAPFPFSEYQAMYFRDILLGKIELGETQQLIEDSAKSIKRLPLEPLKYQYYLGLNQFQYIKKLADQCGVIVNKENDMEALYNLYDVVVKDRTRNPSKYRNKEYDFCKESNTFKMVKNVIAQDQ